MNKWYYVLTHLPHNGRAQLHYYVAITKLESLHTEKGPRTEILCCCKMCIATMFICSVANICWSTWQCVNLSNDIYLGHLIWVCCDKYALCIVSTLFLVGIDEMGIDKVGIDEVGITLDYKGMRKNDTSRTTLFISCTILIASSYPL